ncbi:MAG TPA: radical SAM protein [Spirochaetia bacterium]|nr:radical SAM protein [Spirochaetia bacterium]
MKILLIKPALSPVLFAPMWGDPLELEYLAAAVPNHTVEILDMRVDDDLQTRLEEFRPNLVGVTANTCDVPMALQALREVKKFDTGIVTAVGGHHATFLPADFAEPSVDAIFLGMADISFRDFVSRLENGMDLSEVHNLALVRNGRLEFTEPESFEMNLDRIPFPARHLVARYGGSYRDLTRSRTAQVMSSRGCPFRCTFCSCWKVMNGRYLTRSPESVVEELASLGDEIDSVQFADDNTLHNVERARRLALLIRERKIRKKLSMYARADTVARHPDLMEALKEAGLAHLTIGVESFREETLSTLNKRSSVETNNEAIRILRRMGISNSAHFIVNPDFARSDFQALFHYVCESELFQPTYTVLTPLPGTDLYQELYDRLVIKDYSYYDLGHAVLPTRLSRKEFYRQLVHLYARTYGFPRYFRSLLGGLRSRQKKDGKPPESVDRLSFAKLCILHLVAFPLVLKVLRIHKAEPLIRPAAGNVV